MDTREPLERSPSPGTRCDVSISRDAGRVLGVHGVVMPFGCVKTLWSRFGDEAGAVIPACEVRIAGDYNSVDLFVANGPTVMLTLEEDGSFTVTVFEAGADVRIEKDVDDDFVECRPVEA